MTRRLQWFVLVVCVVAEIQFAVLIASDAKIHDYRVPPKVAQEVARIALAKYARDSSWEPLQYTYYVSCVDKRIDLDRLIREIPAIPRVSFLTYTEGTPLPPLLDELPPKAKSIASIGFVTETRKRVQISILRYVSPLGISTIYYTLERRWWRWRITDETAGKLISINQTKRPNKAPEPTPGSVTLRASS